MGWLLGIFSLQLSYGVFFCLFNKSVLRITAQKKHKE